MSIGLNNIYGQYNVHENLDIKFKCDHCEEIHQQIVPFDFSVIFRWKTENIKSILNWVESKTIESTKDCVTFEISTGFDPLFKMCQN